MNPQLDKVVFENINALRAHRLQHQRKRTLQERIADVITDFSGNMKFVYLHSLWFLAWILLNVGVLPIKPFDPYPFNFLTMMVSLEAIFLSTFVLISQNRMADEADSRAELDLQINLLAEREVTKLICMVDAIADKLGIELTDEETREMEQKVMPEALLEELDRKKNS
jgi:uncharacterized membrane protein